MYYELALQIEEVCKREDGRHYEDFMKYGQTRYISKFFKVNQDACKKESDVIKDMI